MTRGDQNTNILFWDAYSQLVCYDSHHPEKVKLHRIVPYNAGDAIWSAHSGLVVAWNTNQQVGRARKRAGIANRGNRARRTILESFDWSKLRPRYEKIHSLIQVDLKYCSNKGQLRMLGLTQPQTARRGGLLGHLDLFHMMTKRSLKLTSSPNYSKGIRNCQVGTRETIKVERVGAF